MIIKISAKCSDLCWAELQDNEGNSIGQEYDGYVPEIMPGGGGDYVNLEIDTETGNILNWIPPTEKELNYIFKFKKD